DVEEIYQGPFGKFGSPDLTRLVARRALGASDLSRALRYLGETAGKGGGAASRVIIVSDGIATAGETEGGKLRTLVKKLGEQGVQRLDALVDGGIRDEALLKQLV